MEQAAHELVIPGLAWLFGASGWLIYNLILLDKAGVHFDIDQDGYSLHEMGRYGKKNWIGILVSLLLVPVGVVSMPLIWQALTPVDWNFHVSAYFGVGLMSILVQKLIKKLQA